MTPTHFNRPLLVVLITTLSCQAPAALGQGHQTVEVEQSRANDPCATNTGQVAGAVFGALIGGFLGNKIGKGNGKKLATAAGAIGGLALGNYIGSEIDRRKCEVSKIAKKNDLSIVITDIGAAETSEESASAVSDTRIGMSIAIQDTSAADALNDVPGGGELGNAASSSQFQSGSDLPSSRAQQYFREIGGQYAAAYKQTLGNNAVQEEVEAAQRLRQKRVLIVGHTDDTGNSQLNADLSERRARAVAHIFSAAGVPEQNIYFQGSGETQPIADNRTADGRAKNRRVEIVDVTDEPAFLKYLANRAANINFYRVTAAVDIASRDSVLSDQAAPQPAVAAASTGKMVASKPLANKTMTKTVTSTQALATKALPPTSRVVSSGFDFGGSTTMSQAASINIGKLVTAKSSWSLISPALADDMPMARACTDDRPRIANPVRELQGSREYRAAEYLPGMYDTSWVDRVNGNLVALTHVAVLRDGGAPAGKPTVLVYKASQGKLDSKSKADFSTVADVNTYQGEKGLLYRVFVNGPIKCLDIVMRRDQAQKADNANLYYLVGSNVMVAPFTPKLVNQHN